MKFINKLLLLSLLFSTIVYAKTTTCYKNNWNSISTIENIALDGGECDGKFSLSDMKKDGWIVADIKIESEQNNLSYKYILIKDEKNSNLLNAVSSKKSFDINPIALRIENVENNSTTIEIPDLTIGQSGIVVHIYENDKRLIVSNAKVISSNDKGSTIEFFAFDDLKQDAIPTSKRGVQKGDILLLNYMYQSSLLIAPTQELFQLVSANFKYNNFLHTDIFAANLKVNATALPTKESLQEFAIKQNLGTIFIVVNDKVNILDTKTFSILSQYNIVYEKNNLQMPFFTRVENIEDDIFSFSIPFLSEKKPDNYEEYYKYILGIK